MRTYATILVLLLTVPAYAVDTLKVTSPDPLLEDWRWTEFDRRGLSLRDADRYLWAKSFAEDLRAQIAAGFQ